jgi:hypothetical protein
MEWFWDLVRRVGHPPTHERRRCIDELDVIQTRRRSEARAAQPGGQSR